MIEMTEKDEIIEYSQVEAGLQELRRKYGGIAIDVGTTKALDEAKRVRAAIREPRYECEKIRKALKAPALAYAKLIDTEAARITSALMEIETPWDEAIKSEERRREVEKEAELQKERDRIAAHQAVIERIKSMPGLAREARTSAMALQILEKLCAIDTKVLEEFADAAHAAKLAADDQINDIIEAKQAAEAEQARIKAEQEAEAARLAEERQRMEAERAEAARLAAEQQAELLAMQAKMKAQQEELDRQAAEMAQQAAELAARKQAEANRLQPVVTQAEVVALAADPREALAQVIGNSSPMRNILTHIHGSEAAADAAIETAQRETAELNQQPDPVQPTPTAMGLVANIANNFDVEPSTAIRWLAERADEFKSMNTITEVTP